MYKHLEENPESMLSRIYGVYTVAMKNYLPVNLMMMGNTLKFRNKEKIHRIYDLKGSRVARNVDTTDARPTTTLKDLNFFSN